MAEEKKAEETEKEQAAVEEKADVAEETPKTDVEPVVAEETEEAKDASDEKPANVTKASDEKPAKEEKDGSDSAGDDDFEPVRRRKGYGIISGIVHVMATFNNTKVTITDMQGNVIAWRSGGRCGFKGSRKSTAYAATIVAQEAAREAASKGLRECEIRLNGPGAGRESAVRAVHAARIRVTSIQDVTPIPHNGCRPPKRRRV